MPLWGEDAWDHARWGLVGGELPGAADWFQIAYDSDETDILSLAQFGSDMYAGSSPLGKIYTSTDGSSWTLAYDSPEVRINELHVFGSDIYAATGSSGLVYTSSDGSSWTLAYDGPDTDVLALETFGSNLYHGGDGGIIRRSSDGTTWTLAYDGGTLTEVIYDLEVFNSQIYAAVGSSQVFPQLDTIESFWKLEESSGTRSDSIGSNDLSDNNTVTTSTGKLGEAAQFTAANSEYLNIADNTSLSVGDIDFTIACWVYVDSYGDNRTFVAKWEGSTSDREYVVDYQNSTDRFRFLVTNDGSTTNQVTADVLGSPSTDTWYFIVAWHDASANTINIEVNNGGVDFVSHTTGVFDGDADFSLGAINLASTPTSFMDGRIDAVGVWKAVLTSTERTALYNSSVGVQPDGRIITSSNGTTWTVAYDGVRGSMRSIGATLSDFPGGSDTIVAGKDVFEVIKSTDGSSWTLSYDGLDTLGAINVLHVTAGMIYAGPELLGVLYRSDNAVDWSISYDSPATDIHALAPFEDPPKLYVGTGDGGIIYTMDNYVEIDNIVDVISPDGGETVTTDAFTVSFSAPSPYDNAIAHWKLDETSGTRADEVNGQDLTDNNTVTAGTVGIARVGTNFAQFTHTNSEYLNVASTDALSFGDEDMTISCWMWFDNLSDYRPLISKWDAPGSAREYLLDYDFGSSRFRWLVSNDGSSVSIALADNLGVPSTGQWYLVIAWHDSVNNEIGIQINDGTPDTTSHSTGILEGTEDFELGRNRYGDLTRYFSGKMDSVTVFNKVLTSAERSALWNGEKGIEFPLPDPNVVFDMEYSRNHSTNRDWITAVDDQGVTTTGTDLTGFTAWFPKFENMRVHWTLEEASGDRSSIIGSHTLTDNNTVTGAAGKVDQAAQFTRANSEYLNTAHSSNISFGDEYLIMTCWVYLDSKAGNMGIVGKWNADGVSDREYLIWYESSTDRFHFSVSTDGSAVTTVTASNFGAPSTGTWYWIFVQHNPDADVIEINVNNGTVNQAAHSGGINQGTTDLEIGRARFSDSTTNHFDGRIDEVSIFSGGMGSQFQSAIYNSGSGLRMKRAVINGNQLDVSWNVLPIVDSTDMKIRVRARDTTASNGSWNESDDVFTLQNGPC